MPPNWINPYETGTSFSGNCHTGELIASQSPKTQLMGTGFFVALGVQGKGISKSYVFLQKIDVIFQIEVSQFS